MTAWFSAERVLRKEGIRSDRIWTTRLTYLPLFRRIPFWLDIRALMESQYWSRPTMDAYTDDRLRTLVRDARLLSFWKEKIVAAGIDVATMTREDFARLPAVTRLDFDDIPDEAWNDQALSHISFSERTSGSTGKPFHFNTDWYSELRSFSIAERMIREACGGVRYPAVSLRARIRRGFAFFKHSFFFVQNYNNIKHRVPALAETLRAAGSKVLLYGFPSTFIELARVAHEEGYNLPIQAVLATGENISPEDRALVEARLHAPFRGTYATREFGWIAFECAAGKLHINEEWVYVEIVDDAGAPLPEGREGRIAVSGFDNRVTPFIRYDNGDRGVISSVRCSCGRTLRTIEVAGRQIEFITFDDGRTVSALDLSSVFNWSKESVRQFRVVQSEPLTFSVMVIPGPHFERDRDGLTDKLVRLLHPAARIEWETVEEIPAAQSGKAVYFVAYKSPAHHVL